MSPEDGLNDELGFLEMVSILRRRKVLVLTTIVVLPVVVFAASMLLPRTYESVAQLEIQPASSSSSEASQVIERLVDPGKALQTQVELMKSKSVLGPARKRVGLRSASALEQALDVQLLVGTQIIEVAVRNEDPRVARDWVNAVTDSYVMVRRERAQEALSAASGELGRRIMAAEKGLSDVEQEIRDKQSALSVPNPDQDRLIARLTAIEAQLVARLTELDAQLALLPDTQTLGRGGAREISAAETPREPISPRPLFNAALAAIVAAALGAGLAFLAENMDTRKKAEASLTKEAKAAS